MLTVIIVAAALVASPVAAHGRKAAMLDIPSCSLGASIEHSPSFSSLSFEPAFWAEFFGNASTPNNFTLNALSLLWEHGGKPMIRPGGITMDSMIFDPQGSDPVRTINEKGGVYRTTVGPAYYQSWANFPSGTQFVSTMNFGNNSLDIARGLALASMQYQPGLVKFFELGNEPTNYPPQRWNNSTDAYVAQWKEWTASIDDAVKMEANASTISRFGTARWWASSATTDNTPLHVRPADIIPAGIDSKGQVADYSIHSYAFATCDPARLRLATVENILNHTGLVAYADEEIAPSARAALQSGRPWIIGEFNSIACSGRPNVSDTFAQALWEIDTELIYAHRNASACFLHQGATLVFQSDQQSNTAGDDGSPGFSTYDMLYPIDSSKRGKRRILPGFMGLLFLAEAFAVNNTRVRALETPIGFSRDHFSAYAFYNNDRLAKIAILNMKPFYGNETTDITARVNVFGIQRRFGGKGHKQRAYLKRLTAPSVLEHSVVNITWAGQAFADGHKTGKKKVERIGRNGIVTVRASEAVLVFFE